MTLTLPADLEERLARRASQLGMRADAYAQSLIERGLSQPAPDRATLELLAKWQAEDETDDPAELARREAEFEEFKKAMNDSKRQAEGPSARIPYP